MRIDSPNNLLSQTLHLSRPVAESLSQQIGQTLKATVISQDSKGMATLKVADQIVKVETSIKLLEGMEFEVKVDKEGSAIVLRAKGKNTGNQPVAAMLKRLLPNQASLKPLLENIARLELLITEETKSHSAQRESLLQLKQAIQEVFNAQSTAKEITTPDGLKKAILASGQFLENRLATTPQLNLSADMKGAILKLAAQLIRIAAKLDSPPARIDTPLTFQAQPHKPIQREPNQATASRLMQLIVTLMKQAEGALSRIESQQLVNIGRQSQQPEQMVWLLELPIRYQNDQDDSVRMRIRWEKSTSANDENESTWHVTLTIDEELHGKVQIDIRLYTQQLSCTFLTEREDTAGLFEQHLDSLRDNLLEHGIQIESLNCYSGAIEQEHEFRDISGNLLHIKV